MLLISLLLTPLITIFIVSLISHKEITKSKTIALAGSILNLFISLIVFIFYQFSSNQFQFVQEYHSIGNFDFYLGVDGLSIYFVVLTTIIMPVSLLSN
jgi:NADH:ubiquinone oxidoreductase subunit 4 (subunit M)